MTEVKNKVKAAIMSPESGVQEPQRRRSSSFAAQVFDLQIGESASRVTAVPIMDKEFDIETRLPTMREQMRNNCAPAVRQAKIKLDGADYTVEVTNLMTQASKLYVVAIVTRVS